MPEFYCSVCKGKFWFSEYRDLCVQCERWRK